MAVKFTNNDPGWVPNDTDVATDQVSGEEYQVVKVALGLPGSVDTLVDSGQQTAANSVPVTMSSDQPDMNIDIKAPLGQTTMSASIPVVIASDQTDKIRDYHVEVAQGNLSGHAPIAKFGANLDVDIGTEDVWTPGGTRTWISAGITIENISDSTNDTAAGTGAREITVEYVDTSWAAQTGTMATNGTSASTDTIANVMRVNRAFASSLGTYHGVNDGNITIREVGGAVVTMAHIRADKGQTEQTHYTLETGKTITIESLHLSTASNKTISAEFFFMPNVDDVTIPFSGSKRLIHGVVGLAGVMPQQEYKAHPAITGPADFWWEATATSNNTEVQAGFQGMIK